MTMMEYAKRRKALMKKMKDGIAIIPSAPELLRNGDAHYPFRQNSDFYYLTGFTEPEAVLVLAPTNPCQFVLFNRERDPAHEIWTGERAGQAGACKHYGADQAFPIGQFKRMLPILLTGQETVYYPFGYSAVLDKMIVQAIDHVRKNSRSGASFPTQLIDIAPTLHEMRLIKSKAELALMQQAVDISAAAHIAAMQICEPGMNECELDAIIAYEFKRRGAKYSAYSSIVGAGRHTCVLHYDANDQKINNGDLVLIDAGAEYQYYAADITRTFPANGKFSAEQRAIYEIVLAAQKAALKLIKPGTRWGAPEEAIIRVITEGLVDVGILKGNVSDLIEKKAYADFYMHRYGHWLGLDVHDVGAYKIKEQWRRLEPGMVLTVEPGIYISSKHSRVARQWHHIGVRIEDDVLVTKQGHDVLSKAIPKTIADIEAIMKA